MKLLIADCPLLIDFRDSISNQQFAISN